MSPAIEVTDTAHQDRAGSATDKVTVAVVGLGEVGRTYGAAISAAGHRVLGYDAYAPGPVDGVEVCGSLAEAVAGADIVLVLTTAAASRPVAEEAVTHLREGASYVDCTSSAPAGKRELLAVFADRPDVTLADVAILGPVIQLGVGTPLMAAGPAGPAFAILMTPLGSKVDVIEGDLGDAMARKLLRSVFMKGLAATVTEAVTAGHAIGFEDWIRAQIARELSGDGQRTIDRFLSGSVLHAQRRGEEMEAAAAYLNDLGVDSTIATATARHLRGIREQ